MEPESSSTNLSAEIYRTLKDRIIRWEYLPDQRLTEIGLCEEFGVSRSPIREVLKMLEENGLVVKAPKHGYTVRQPGMDEIFELYEFRLALETFVVGKLAANGLRDEVLADLTGKWQAYLAKPDVHLKNISFFDENFHETLAFEMGNSILYKKLKEVNERIHFLRLYDITTPERLKMTCVQHLEILNTIKKGDIEGAKEMMSTNIHDGRINVDQAVKEALSRAYFKSSENS